ncbi:hypothetical protein HGRIS_000254 [Hohenbuehelia grisea]|uniref:F-box domain-containing protein n=1 Tax=Hohenbuehelia grisea TaxID=104357 RepID=A0ABR3JSG6_9AGAR
MSEPAALLFTQQNVIYDGTDGSIVTPAGVIPSIQNGVISDEDALYLRTLLASAESDARILDAELDEAVVYVARLQKLRDSLEGLRKRLLGPLSSIHRLPAEILAQIFIYCLEQNTLDVTKPPWTLGMVCQRWRSVALSTSALWNTIWLQSHHLKAITLRSVSIKMLLALLEEYIRRCTTAINIRMDCNGPHLRMFNRIPMAIYHEILVTVTRYSARWGSVELSIDEPSFDILRSITTPLPMLCSLSITFWPTNNPTNNPTFTRLSILSQAPQLTTAHISTPLQLIQLPHVQLQKLRVEFRKPFTAYDYEVLRDLVNLRHLHTCISRGISGPLPPERLTFNQLVSLAFTDGAEILDHLTLPSLREFKLVRYVFRSLPELPMLCHMLGARSHCNIMHLHLNMVMITAQELSMLLDALPSITSLTFDVLPETTRDIFVALTMSRVGIASYLCCGK